MSLWLKSCNTQCRDVDFIKHSLGVVYMGGSLGMGKLYPGLLKYLPHNGAVQKQIAGFQEKNYTMADA